MDDESRTNQVLIRELASLKERISDLEEELRESEENYRNILENIEEVYFEVDRAGDFTFFNPSLCRSLGYTREEMSGMNYRVLMDAENANKVFQAFSEVYLTKVPTKCVEWEVIKKDGARIYIEVLISVIVRPGEKPTRFRGIARDITERKRLGEKL
jgi:PAS domain S-box-containing protein